MLQTLPRIFAAVFLLPLIASVSPAQAEDGEASPESVRAPTECMVTVRALKGSRPSDKADQRELQAGKFLTDVKNQLEVIPYSSFKVVDSVEKKVKLGSREEFTLIDAGEAHRLSIKPCSVSGERVQVSVDWKAPNGSSLLSTKVGIVKGKSVVVGADSATDSSTIMCIKVDC